MSLPEVLLWQRLRGGKGGVRFRRQHPIGPYVVDFYCADTRLVVEIDGGTHDFSSERDAERDAFLARNGYRVFRVSAAAVLSDPDRIADAIASAARPLHHSAVPSGPPPRAGEEL